MVIALLLTGCTGGPIDQTRVEELRLMAMVFEPPEAQPAEAVSLTVYIADPLEEGADAGAWTCASDGTACLEEGADRLQVADAAAPITTLTLRAPPEVEPLLGGAEEIPVSTWALACTPGTCPLLEGNARAEDLADPDAWLSSLPITGVTLGRSTLLVSDRAVGERLENPEIVPQFDPPLCAEPEEIVPLTFDADTSSATAYGYTTGGASRPSMHRVSTGRLRSSGWHRRRKGAWTCGSSSLETRGVRRSGPSRSR